MSLFLTLHPENPQIHLLRKIIAVIKESGVIVYPTDSGYALACQMGNKKALDRIRTLRHLDKNHHFTLVFSDLSQLSSYAVLDDAAYRILKTYLPGPYTFILKATKETPRRLMHPKRKTIGVRIPDHPIVQAILETLEEPLMSASLTIPGKNINFLRAQAINDIMGSQVDLVIDGGDCGLSPTSVIDLSSSTPQVLRIGKGEVDAFL